MDGWSLFVDTFFRPDLVARYLPSILKAAIVTVEVAVLVVATAGLGTLNHTALTLESLAVHRLSCAGLVIGSWPASPGTVETSNRGALARMAPVRAALPAGAALMDAAEFAGMSARAFDPAWVSALAR